MMKNLSKILKQVKGKGGIQNYVQLKDLIALYGSCFDCPSVSTGVGFITRCWKQFPTGLSTLQHLQYRFLSKDCLVEIYLNSI